MFTGERFLRSVVEIAVQSSDLAATSGDSGIEGARSQEFSVGIFAFLIICICVFTAVVITFMRSGKGKSLRTGEKILFGWIFLGIVVAVIMGITQILYGQLF